MKEVVKIPNVSLDERIGSAFNFLFKVIHETESSYNNGIEWDLSDTEKFHPFFLAPLVIYKDRCEKDVFCSHKPPKIDGYLNLIHFDSPLLINEGVDIEKTLQPYINKSYLPISKFELHKGNVDGLQSILQKVIRKQSNADYDIISPMSYLLGELIDNMNEHSKGKYGYIFSQYLAAENCIDLVLADDGITIYGSYAASKKYLDEINGNEAEALKLANEGKSTKNLPDAENRGYGISSSKRMLVEGLNGSFFMLSGGAFHRHDCNGSSFVKLPKTINWSGTVILMRIPVNIPSDFDFNRYTL